MFKVTIYHIFLYMYVSLAGLNGMPWSWKIQNKRNEKKQNKTKQDKTKEKTKQNKM